MNIARIKDREFLHTIHTSGKTQKEIADEIGLKPGALSHKLKHIQDLKISEYNAICHAINIDPRIFITFINKS